MVRRRRHDATARRCAAVRGSAWQYVAVGHNTTGINPKNASKTSQKTRGARVKSNDAVTTP